MSVSHIVGMFTNRQADPLRAGASVNELSDTSMPTLHVKDTFSSRVDYTRPKDTCGFETH